MTTDAATPATEARPAATKQSATRSTSVTTGKPASSDGKKPTRRENRARRKLRARRVERIMRRIDPWSVLKLSFLFFLCLWVIFMMAGVMLWTAAVSSGAIDNVETFITDLFALESFAFEGEQLFRGAGIGGLVMVLVSTGFSVLISILFNLISDMTGGIRVSVIELENVRQPGQP